VGEKSRTSWIIVAALATFVLCSCVPVTAAVAVGLLRISSLDLNLPDRVAIARTERAFEVDAAPRLKIDNFAGSITVRAGRSGEIRILATREVPRISDMDQITMEMSERGGKLVIRTQKAASLRNASVQLEITAPADTRLDLYSAIGDVQVHGLSDHVRTRVEMGSVTLSNVGGEIDVSSGAGNIEVDEAEGILVLDTHIGSVVLFDVTGRIDARSDAGNIEIYRADGTIILDTDTGSVKMLDITGDIDARCDAGNIDVLNGRAQVRLDTGTGSIQYDGRLQGDSRFESKAGSITLRLPPDLNAALEIGTEKGTVHVEYGVEGHVSKCQVVGIVGDGDDTGSIYAHTQMGIIDVVRR
jgi:hypothetical protein